MAWLFRRKKNDADDTGGKTGSNQLGRVAGVTGEADSDSETSTGAISPADTGSSSSRQSDGSSTGRSSEEETLVDGQQSEYGAMLDGTATDSLVTRQYSVVGELPTVNESKSADDSGDSGNAVIAAKQCPSAVALVEGDSDARVASLKTVGKVKANRTVEAGPDAGSENSGDSSSADASSWPGPGDARVAWYSDGERVAG